jgi:hypothetical protein
MPLPLGSVDADYLADWSKTIHLFTPSWPKCGEVVIKAGVEKATIGSG